MPGRSGPARPPIASATSPLRALLAGLLVAASLVGAATLALPTPAAAQLASKADPNAKKMLVEADELVQNQNDNTVTASGNVRIYYDGRTLEADRVVYNKTTKRVVAVGHAKLTEKDGTVSRGDKFDLTDDFHDGFIESLRTDTPQQTHFSSPRTERVADDTTTFEKGTYSACDACKDHPSRPPLWRVRAQRIIHKNDEKMIYYEDARLEFLGIPVAYTPWMSAPDPTVTKKSGLLTPNTTYRSQLGYGVGVPVFYNLAPDYDLTVTPTIYSEQGFFGAAEFRQKFSNGLYYIRVSGIDELNPDQFYLPPYGAGRQRLRGDIDTKGEFDLSPEWKFGWSVTALSDKYYLNDYQIPADTLASNYISESISTIYLTGQGDRSFFDLRGYYIQGLTSYDIQQQQPIVHPVLDYNRTVDIDPAKTHGVGGQLEFDFNLTSLSAAAASYEAVGARTLDSAYNLYDVCNTYMPGRVIGSSCLLRGIGGDYTRATGSVDYQRKFIDPLGEVWTPFAFARFSGETLNLNTSNTYSFANAGNYSSFSNASQPGFLPGSTGDTGNIIPGVGVEYRYPFMAYTKFGSIVVEPIGQIIARPDNVIGTRSLVNIDSQSLVFDSTNLFDWSKYSGYDQFETGVRANYGGQLSVNFKNGGYFNLLAGQSAQLAGTNSYATADAANVGLSSGLDTRMSDYVIGTNVSPLPLLSLGTQARFDDATFEMRRIDTTLNLNLGPLTGGVQFANYDAQPLIGYSVRREGLSFNSKYKFAEHYFVQGNITFDLSRQYYSPMIIGSMNASPWTIAASGLGVGYEDECTTFTVNYTSSYQYNAGFTQRDTSVVATLSLRTLGDIKFNRASTSQTGSGPTTGTSNGLPTTGVDGVR
jgi:LPS-assembly protein